MSNFEKTIFYRENCVKAKETGDGMEYTIECIDGTGTMLCYEVFPGLEYLREYRLEQAAVALQKTVKSITEIALDAGFTNPGKFSETFKRRYGMTPTDYRNYEKLNTEMD